MKNRILANLILILFLNGCATPTASPAPPTSHTPASVPLLLTASPTLATLPSTTATPLRFAPTQTIIPRPGALGPEADSFPDGVNPLTGQPVLNPALLELPAVLVSISNMPATTRPQAGPGFAAWLFELYIGTGATRFMGVFYGDYPRRIPNLTGNCPVNESLFQPEDAAWVGGRVWLDENLDGAQNAWEAGIGGICVSLTNAAGESLAATSSDSNGYYAIPASVFRNPEARRSQKLCCAVEDFQATQPPGNLPGGYTLFLDVPETYLPTVPGDNQAHFSYNSQTGFSWNLGLALKTPPALTPTPHPNDIAPQRTYVGPIRSGRLTYETLRKMFPASCLVFASAGRDILSQLEICEIIYGEHPEISPNTALLDVAHMRELAERSKIAGQPVNYSGHLFDPLPPPGGQPANSLLTYYHRYTQAAWRYDPLSGKYLRFTDDADGLGNLHADTERLTGRQLAFENVIILMAEYQVYRYQQYDINLRYGLGGWAYLFRDGLLYKIRWSTLNRAWEQSTGLLRPLHFVGDDGQPFPLKPGQTWISLMTPNSAVNALEPGQWRALFAAPNDPPPTPEK